MLKKFTALVMSLVMCLSIATPAFAHNSETEIDYSYETIYEDDFEKTVMYLNELKVVTWDSGNEFFAEQYDEDGNLVERVIGNRDTKEIITENINGVTVTRADDIFDEIEVIELPVPRAFKKVGSVRALSTLTGESPTMYIYEETESAIQTTYTLKRYNGTFAGLAASVAVSLGIKAFGIAGLAAELIALGIGTATNIGISVTSQVTMSAKKYVYNYYGKDSRTGKKSSTFEEAGVKYVVNDAEKIIYNNKTYYDGYVYGKTDNDIRLSEWLIQNLYDTSYFVY